jgi:phosphoribosylamine--glycine ligase
VDGRLDAVEAEWDRRTALGVVLAAHGYPDAPRRGDEITSLAPEADDCVTFHAGTALDGDRLVVTGGRVLCVTALGDSVRTAQKRAYEAIAQTRFDGMQYRRDIGHLALKARA